jgi:hypothetical protein
MPQDRLDQIPWLVCGRMLLTPLAPREGGLLAHEAVAIEQMGRRLEHDRHAGLLPDCTAFWCNPVDGAATPLAAPGAWLRVTALQHVVVDLHLLQAMGRVVPVTLLARRLDPAPLPVPAATQGRPTKAQALAAAAALLPAGSIALGQVAQHMPVLVVACSRCDCAGRYGLNTLIARHGRSAAFRIC